MFVRLLCTLEVKLKRRFSISAGIFALIAAMLLLILAVVLLVGGAAASQGNGYYNDNGLDIIKYAPFLAVGIMFVAFAVLNSVVGVLLLRASCNKNIETSQLNGLLIGIVVLGAFTSQVSMVLAICAICVGEDECMCKTQAVPSQEIDQQEPVVI